MISYSQFKLLEQNRQAGLLWLQGVYLQLVRQTKKFNIELYALNDFYVEIHFNKTTGEPLLLKPFIELKRLDLYLSLISIENIFELG